jgi:hypothetical protein
MANHDDKDTGIPTRAIHEAYLNLQQAHRQFRRAKDNPARDETPAHADFQDAVLTFYELARPHLKRKSGMRRFWEGKLPNYPDTPWESTEQAKQHCERAGTAIWTLQEHVQSVPAAADNTGNGAAIADGAGSLREYHDQLGLTDRQRIVAVKHQDGVLLWKELRAVAGLQQLDRWDTRETRERKSGSGFMAGETHPSVSLTYVPVWKLTKAKRLLAEAADKLNLLSRVEIDHEDGAIVNFDMSREGAVPEYRDAEYSSSPDI